MSERGEELDADRLRTLFQEVSDRLEARGQVAQLFVVGGAAMALAYDASRPTRDVDGVFEPASTIREIAEEIADAHGLEPDWINDAAKGFLPGQDEAPRTVFESEALLVQVPSPGYLLAMKLHAARDERDLSDAATLWNHAGLGPAEDGRELMARTYPSSLLLPRHRYIVEDVASRAAEQRQARATTSRDATRQRLAERIGQDVKDAPARGPRGDDQEPPRAARRSGR